MDTLSTPLSSSVKHGGGASSSLLFPATNRDTISLLKHSSLHVPSASALSIHTKTNPLNNSKSKPSTVPKPRNFVAPLSSSSKSKRTHDRAATGYAAAIADASSRAGTFSDAGFDARRLIGFVRGVVGDPVLEEFDKAAKVNKAVNAGGFEKHVVAIIKLLVKKGNIGLIEEVMMEFLRICDELTGTKTVVVGPSEARMESSKLEKIARNVQRFNGASRVKILHAFAA